MRDAFDMPLELILTACDADAGLSTATLPPGLRGWISTPDTAPVLVRIASASTMTGYVLVRDLDGNSRAAGIPACRVTCTRSVSARPARCSAASRC